MPDFAHGCGNGECRQVCAAAQGFVVDAGQGVREIQEFQRCAVHQRLHGQDGQRVRQVDAIQRGAARKDSAADGCHRIGERDFDISKEYLAVWD